MPRCGSCGWEFSNYTLTKHAYTPCGEEDRKAPAQRYSPELDDLIRSMEEDRGGDE
jgi:hypothetical protein